MTTPAPPSQRADGAVRCGLGGGRRDRATDQEHLVAGRVHRQQRVHGQRGAAYYLQYRNVRPDYVQKLWSPVNWSDVTRRFDLARAGGSTLPNV
ncbi:Fe-Mn family superoxide dismutase [Kutzneria sp. NPDC052558]|uniref:Fe-Mn family superoxide dismutase n=1 Tax=Kutzneria sp. NPDC052558 TaxID=3364121 RepID=UPI0037C5CA98